MKGKNVTLATYEPKKGNVESKLPNKRQLVGYMPMEKRIAALKVAGLRTAYDSDKRFFDYIKGSSELEFIPPLPRHIPADLTDVAELARHYAEKRSQIELRLEEERKRIAKEKIDNLQKPPPTVA